MTLVDLTLLAGVERMKQPPRLQSAPGVTDPGLSDLIVRNESLQSELELLQNEHRAAGHQHEEFGRVLFELHRRRTNRAAAAAGVGHDR